MEHLIGSLDAFFRTYLLYIYLFIMIAWVFTNLAVAIDDSSTTMMLKRGVMALCFALAFSSAYLVVIGYLYLMVTAVKLANAVGFISLVYLAFVFGWSFVLWLYFKAVFLYSAERLFVYDN